MRAQKRGERVERAERREERESTEEGTSREVSTEAAYGDEAKGSAAHILDRQQVRHTRVWSDMR